MPPSADESAPEGQGEAPEDLLARVQAWIDDDPSPTTADQLQKLVYQAEDGRPPEVAAALDQLRELFSGALAFGTAGIRDPMGSGPNRMNRAIVRRVGAAVAAWVRSTSSRASEGVVIGRDAREGSDLFVGDLVEVIAGAGLPVHVLPALVPTPVTAFAVRHLGMAAGIMVTASHNPAPDNGLKVYDDEGRQIDGPQADAIVEAMAGLGPTKDLAASGAGNPLIHHHHDLDIVDAYIAAIVEDVLVPRADRTPVEVAHTALHGVGAAVVRQACRRAGFVNLHEVGEQVDPDPTFPTVPFPNPEEPGALRLVLREAAWHNADVALANDPDADRLAMAVHDPMLGDQRDPAAWRALTGDELGWLLADHLVRRGPLPAHGVFVTTIASSTLLRSLALDAGVGYAETLTGFKWVVRASGPGRPFLFGYEEALGYCVGETVRDKDGIGTLLVAAEMVSDLVAHGVTAWERLDDIARRFGVHVTGQLAVRLEGTEGAARIAAAMGRLRTQPPTAIAGRAVAGVADLAQGSPERGLPAADVVGLALQGARVVVRPSGTEPKLKAYVEVVEPVPAGAEVAPLRSRARDGLDQIVAALPEVLGLD